MTLYVAIDTETTGLKTQGDDVPFMIVAMIRDTAGGPRDGEEYVWELPIDAATRSLDRSDPRYNEAVIDFESFLLDVWPEATFVFHNLKFDLHALAHVTPLFDRNFSLHDDSLDKLKDTLSASHVLDNLGSHGLKDLGHAYLGIVPRKKDAVKGFASAISRYAKKCDDIELSTPAADMWLAKWCVDNRPELIEQAAPSLIPLIESFTDSRGKELPPVDAKEAFRRGGLKTATDDMKRERAAVLAQVMREAETVTRRYATEDVRLTLLLDGYLSMNFLDPDNLEHYGKDKYAREEIDTLWMLYLQEKRGIRLKPKRLREKIKSFEERVERRTRELRRLTKCPDFNPDSSPQRIETFFGMMGFPVVKKSNAGQPSFDKDVVLSLMIQYLQGLSETDRLSILEAENFDDLVPQEIELDAFNATEEEYRTSFLHACVLRCYSDRSVHIAALRYLKSYDQKSSLRPVPAYREVGKITTAPGVKRLSKPGRKRRRFEIVDLSREEACLFGSWNPSGTGSGRLSSSDPNVQNWSKGKEDEILKAFLESEALTKATVRDIFGPNSEIGDRWFPIDYSQLQIRLFAYASGDEALISALHDGDDLHTAVARRMYRVDKPSKTERKSAKYVNFGILFGAGPAKIDLLSGIPNSYETFMRAFRKAPRFMDQCIRQANRYGFIETIDGLRLRVPQNRAYAATCYRVQGDEARIVKKAMVGLERRLAGTPLRPIAQIHDEIVFEYVNPFRSKTMSKGARTAKSRNLMKSLVGIAVEVMEGVGREYGCELPVDAEVSRKSLAETEDFSLV